MSVYTLTGQPIIASSTIVQSVGPSRCRGCWSCGSFIRHAAAAAISAATVSCAAVQNQRAVQIKLKHASLPACRETSGTASDAIEMAINLHYGRWAVTSHCRLPQNSCANQPASPSPGSPDNRSSNAAHQFVAAHSKTPLGNQPADTILTRILAH